MVSGSLDSPCTSIAREAALSGSAIERMACTASFRRTGTAGLFSRSKPAHLSHPFKINVRETLSQECSQLPRSATQLVSSIQLCLFPMTLHFEVFDLRRCFLATTVHPEKARISCIASCLWEPELISLSIAFTPIIACCAVSLSASDLIATLNCRLSSMLLNTIKLLSHRPCTAITNFAQEGLCPCLLHLPSETKQMQAAAATHMQRERATLGISLFDFS